MRPQKTTVGHRSSHSGLGNQTHRPRNKKDAVPQKRLSVDAPIPTAKRKSRRRKLSSSNESSTSEAPSNVSDFVQAAGQQALEQGRPLAVLGEAGSEGGGRRGDRVARREEVLHVAGPYSKMDGGSSHVVSPVDVLNTTAGAGGGGGGGGGGRGKRGSTR